jgi:hypothetical protein
MLVFIKYVSLPNLGQLIQALLKFTHITLHIWMTAFYSQLQRTYCVNSWRLPFILFFT